MLYIFTYYNQLCAPVFLKSMKSLSAKLQYTDGRRLIIIADFQIPTKTVVQLKPLFEEVMVVKPKMFTEDGLIRRNDLVNVNFLETLLLYPEYDRLYVDPNLFFLSTFGVPVDSSLFFRQHTGLLSTKIAYLKAGPQFSTAVSAFIGSKSYRELTDQALTYIITNNHLIKKTLHGKNIVSGRLFEQSQVKTMNEDAGAAIDMTGCNDVPNSKTMRVVETLSAAQRPIVLPGIRRATEYSPTLLDADVEVFGKKPQQTTTKTKAVDRSSLDRMLSEVETADPSELQTFFKNPSRPTVIIPVYKNASVLATCLSSILESTDDFFNLVIINDSPFDKEVETLCLKFSEIFKKQYKKSEYVFLTNEKNLGFVKTVNRGLGMTDGDVVILNTDTIVSPGWLTRMLEYKNLGRVASVTPLSNSGSQCSFPIQGIDQDHYRGLRPGVIDSVLSKLPISAGNPTLTGVGFCMLMTKEALSKVGKFDDVTFNLGYGEENDWCYRASKEGFINVLAPSVYVAHEHGVSFSSVSNLSAIRNQNKAALIRKHPRFFKEYEESSRQDKFPKLYPILKYAIDFHQSNLAKKKVVLVMGDAHLPEEASINRTLVYVRLISDSFEVSSPDFLKNKSTIFARGFSSLTNFMHLMDPESVIVQDKMYLLDPEIKEFMSELEKTDDKKTKIVVEIPFYSDEKSGGIERMMKLVMELPFYSTTSGGVIESLKFLKKFPKEVEASARFQRIFETPSDALGDWTVGLPDASFPKCDVCITYSDNPYINQLVSLPQVKKVLIYMLSYGMAIEREKKNVTTPGVTVMCSTKKLEREISKDAAKVHRVGFALDMEGMTLDPAVQRKNYAAILYHPTENKGYATAVRVANSLYRDGRIDGVITFGSKQDYDKAVRPDGLVKHYFNANRDQIREIFNTCKVFIMPSVSEGLNLSPVESTLCGCPAVICDGAIDEIFFDGENCMVARKHDENQITKMASEILESFDAISAKFEKKMKSIVSEYTWERVVKNIMKLV